MHSAQVATTGEEADRLLAKILPDESEVVGPYLADAALDAQAKPVLLHYREPIRTLGPSNRKDLGRQAESQNV